MMPHLQSTSLIFSSILLDNFMRGSYKDQSILIRKSSISFFFIFDHVFVIRTYNISYSLSGVPDYFDRNKISSGGDLSHYSSASLY